MRIYRASSLGYSLEALVAPFLGFEAIDPPEYMQAVFDEGNRLEPVILEQLASDDWFLDSEQREVEFEVIPGVAMVVGHLDAIRHYQDQPRRVVEVKTMNPKTWDTVLAKGWDAGGLMEKYKWQQAAYTLATGLGHLMVCYNKHSEKLHVITHDEPFYSVADIALKLQAAEDHIQNGIIPEGCTDFPCPYFYLHAEKEEPEPADEELNKLLDAYQEVNARKKAAENEGEELKAAIKEYVGAEMAGKVKGSQGVMVSTTWVPEKEVSYLKAGHWETRITLPRKGKEDVAPNG